MRGGATALALALAWAGAATLARWIGAWPALGSAAVLLGGVALRETRPRPRGRDLLIGALTGAAMVAATDILFALFAARAPRLASETAVLYHAFRTLPWAHALILIVPVVVGEELVWRGAVQGALQARFGPIAAALITTLAYAAAHAPLGSIALALAALGGGLVWSGLRAWTSGPSAGIAAHLVWDLVILLLRPLA